MNSLVNLNVKRVMSFYQNNFEKNIMQYILKYYMVYRKYTEIYYNLNK